jgi:hypothetical protein
MQTNRLIRIAHTVYAGAMLLPAGFAQSRLPKFGMSVGAGTTTNTENILWASHPINCSI